MDTTKSEDLSISRWKRPVRLFLSVCVIFHVICILVSPQRESFMGHALAPWFDRYAQTLELQVSWSFFAPEPGPPPVFVEWESMDGSGAVLGKGRFPDEQSPFWLRERQNRRIVIARFMMSADHRAEGVMLFYLCRQKPEVKSVRIWRIQYSVPGMSEVFRGDRRIGDDRGSQRRLASHSFCPEGA